MRPQPPLICATAAMAVTPGIPIVVGVPRYIVDLDAPPEHRWTQIIDDYKHHIRAIDAYARNVMILIFGSIIGPPIDAIVRCVLKTFAGRAAYAAEMKAVAKQAGMDLGRLLIMQHIYETAACCTSIVAADANGQPLHIRCMDWGMDMLKPLTIEVDVRKGGRTIFLATTWAGFLGVFTGMRPGEWSCSLNYRATQGGSVWHNLKALVKGASPAGFLIRHLLESEADFSVATHALATTPLVAPCYLAIAGAQPGQGVLITRNRRSEEHRWQLGRDANDAIVQTNIDHWSHDWRRNVMESIERRQVAVDAFEQLRGQSLPVTVDWLWTLLSTRPIRNKITLYATLMIPGQSVLVTRLPQPKYGFVPIRRPPSLSLQQPVKILPADANYAQVAQLISVPPLQSVCAHCHSIYRPYTNSNAKCAHRGVWHAARDDCTYIKCAWYLGWFNLNKPHWSCCYSLNHDNPVCEASGGHTPL